MTSDVTSDVTDLVAAALAAASTRVATPEAIAAYDRSIAEARDRESREARARRRRALVDAGIPLRDEMLKAVLDGTLKPSRALRAVVDWLATTRPVIALIGPPGVGKTVAATHAAVTRLSRGSVVYTREPTLARWGMFARYDREWTSATQCATLIVDEMGTALPRDLEPAKAALLRVVDDRMSRGRRTVLVGNLSRDMLAARTDQRLLDRLHEIGTIVDLPGRSLRSGT